MHIFELNSFPIEQITVPEQFAENLGAWFSERPWPIRLLAYNRPCNLQLPRMRIREQIQRLSQNKPGDWSVPWLRDAAFFLEALEQRHLRSARYLLMTWEPHDLSSDALLPTIRRAFQRPATRIERLPSILGCGYTEQATMLCPERVGAPYLACLLSHDMRGEIDIDVLHPLMGRPYDLALAIDIQTRPQSRTLARSERAYMTARAAASDWRSANAWST